MNQQLGLFGNSHWLQKLSDKWGNQKIDDYVQLNHWTYWFEPFIKVCTIPDLFKNYFPLITNYKMSKFRSSKRPYCHIKTMIIILTWQCLKRLIWAVHFRYATSKNQIPQRLDNVTKSRGFGIRQHNGIALVQNLDRSENRRSENNDLSLKRLNARAVLDMKISMIKEERRFRIPAL